MQRKWSIRAYREGDEKGILELWEAMNPEEKYDREQWLRWWRWMYKDNPAGVGKIYLAEDGGKIVGHSAVLFAAMKVGAEVVTSFQSIDTMTHPNYRRQGIYTALAKRVYAEAARENVHIGYRFPSRLAHPIAIKKLDWFDVCTRQPLVRPVNWQNALRLKVNDKFLLKLGAISGKILQETVYRTRKAPTARDLTITQVSSFDDRVDELWNRVSNQYKVMIVRNKKYLNWRYVEVPNVNYTIFVAERHSEICGYIVARCVKRQGITHGYIFDVIASSGPAVINALLLKVIEYFKEERTDLILCYMIADKMYRDAFRRNGFISIPFIKLGWLCAYSSSPSPLKELLKNRKNWFGQLGDSDMV